MRENGGPLTSLAKKTEDFFLLPLPSSLLHLFLPRPRVRLVIRLHQHVDVEMRVPLGGRQTGMAQEFLDGAEIRSGFEQVRGEAVTERVRACFARQPELFSIIF